MANQQQCADPIAEKELMGFFTHPGTTSDYLELIASHIGAGNFTTVYYHNLHTVYVYFSNEAYRQSYNNKTVIVDGMVLLFLYKLSGLSLSRDYRVTYVEFIMPLMQKAQARGWRVFHIGQEAAVQEKALSIIRRQVPGINISGHHGYFDFAASSEQSQAVIQAVNAYSTDLLLVGLGSPNQELWVDAHRTELHAPVVMTCGSCMEYVAGNVKTAPRWLGQLGLEALFRIYADPKRLAYRYLVEPLLLIFILLRNWFQKRTNSFKR